MDIPGMTTGWQCRACYDVHSSEWDAERCCRPIQVYSCEYCDESFSQGSAEYHQVEGKCPREMENEQRDIV